MATETDFDLEQVREAMGRERDVKRVLGLRQQTPGLFLYCIETPFSFPRFVIGTSDVAFEDVHPEHKMGAYWNLRQRWLELTGESLPEEMEGA